MDIVDNHVDISQRVSLHGHDVGEIAGRNGAELLILAEAAVRKILLKLKSLASEQESIRLVGYQENIGHKLVPEDAAAEVEKS